ncbi:kinesin-like protein KIF16B isoform X11 [Podarcis muralis]
MSDLSKSCENLSAVMLYNPGLEFERQQREELEKLESKRKLIEEMEEKQKSNKAELERMQQEVESQRKETEIVQLQIRKQEENLKRKSFHIESRMKDLLAEKEKFEEERLREQQEIELQKKKQEEEFFARVKEELQRLQELNQNEKAEKMQIFRELEKLKKEKEEQYIKLELEKRRLEEEERDQVLLVANLEEQLRDKQAMIHLVKLGDAQRAEEEKKNLEDIRESLLRVKEARSEGDENSEELEKAQYNYMDFKRRQLEQLTSLERDLVQQRDHLEKDVAEEHENLNRLKCAHAQHLNLEKNDEMDAALTVEECSKIKSCEYRLQLKERQLVHLTNNHLPALLEEKQRASEVLDRGLQNLDNTLYEVEKEMEEKEDQLAQYRATASQLQQLQETFEFTANVARQEEKVRKKEKEILESKQKQQREALEQAVAKLERRHSALQRHSTIEIEEQKQKLATLNSSCSEQAGLQATLEAEQKALEEDREHLDFQIQQLKQKIYEGDGVEKGSLGAGEERLSHSSSPSSVTKSQSHFIPLVDDRINAFIEEEVQRRLQNIHYTCGENNNSLLQSAELSKDNEKFYNDTAQRKLKYEKMPLYGFLALPTNDSQCYTSEDTRIADISKQDESIDAFNPHWRRVPEFCMTQKTTNKKRQLGQEYIRWLCSNECDSNQPKVINSKRTCSKYSADFHLQAHDRYGMIHSSESKSACSHFDSTGLAATIWGPSSLGAESDLVVDCRIPPSELLASAKHQSGACISLSLREHSNQIPQICAQIPNQQLDERATNASQIRLPESHVGTKQRYGLGHLFSKFSSIYSDTNYQAFKSSWFSKQIKGLASLCDKNETCTQMVSFVKDFPFIKKIQLNLLLGVNKNSFNDASIIPGSPVPKDEDMKFLHSGISIDMCTADHSERYTYFPRREKLETSLVLKQNFVCFSDGLLKLQLCSQDELLQYVTYILPEICAKPDELKGIYWIAVGNRNRSGPEPACLLLLSSVLYAITTSANPLESSPDSLEIFHVFPITTLREIQIGYAGQSIRLLCSNEENIMKIFTFNKYFTQRICHDILSIVISSSESAYLNHPLLKGDLLHLSLDWASAISDLVFENGLRLSCSFEANLADLVYLLHGNMGINKPPLGEIQILLYTTVKLEGKIRSLVLTNTHVGLVEEDSIFCPVPSPLHSLVDQLQFDKIQLHCLSELKCIVVLEKENLIEIELVFSRAGKVGCDSFRSLACISQREAFTQLRTASPFCHAQPSTPPYIWKLTFSSNEDAIKLMLHLTGQ